MTETSDPTEALYRLVDSIIEDRLSILAEERDELIAVQDDRGDVERDDDATKDIDSQIAHYESAKESADALIDRYRQRTAAAIVGPMPLSERPMSNRRAIAIVTAMAGRNGGQPISFEQADAIAYMSTIKDFFAETDDDTDVDGHAGLKCPKCGNTRTFEVTGTTVRMVKVDGESNCIDDPGGDIEWDERAPMVCSECQHEGVTQDFTPKEKR